MVVVGGGDSAMEEALFLARMASHVTDRAPARPVPRLEDHGRARARATRRSPSLERRGRGGARRRKVEAVRVRDTVTGEHEDIPAAAMFVAIGHDPNTALFAGQLELDDGGLRRHRTARGRASRASSPAATCRTRVYKPGDHRGRQRLHGRHGRGALARGAAGHARDPRAPTGALASGKDRRDGRRCARDHERQLPGHRPGEREARADRLLGRVVRPVPHADAPVVEQIAKERDGLAGGRQAQRRRARRDRPALQRAGHPVPRALRARPARAARRRRRCRRRSSSAPWAWSRPVPSYDLACTACDHRFEAFRQGFLRDEDRVCPECGAARRPVSSSPAS